MKQTSKQKASKQTEPVGGGGKHSDLAETIEALRKEKFPRLPKTLVAKILRIEAEHPSPDDRHAAQADLGEAVELYLESKED